VEQVRNMGDTNIEIPAFDLTVLHDYGRLKLQAAEQELRPQFGESKPFRISRKTQEYAAYHRLQELRDHEEKRGISIATVRSKMNELMPVIEAFTMAFPTQEFSDEQYLSIAKNNDERRPAYLFLQQYFDESFTQLLKKSIKIAKQDISRLRQSLSTSR